MIQPQNLRIGSVLNDLDGLAKIVTLNDIADCVNHNKWFNSLHSPIELTEGVLRACGFESSHGFDNCFVITYGQLDLIIFTSETLAAKENNITGFYYWFSRVIIEIKYLHELQDLFRVLTGKELQIDLEKLK